MSFLIPDALPGNRMRGTRPTASGLTGSETRTSLLRFNWSAGLRSIFETVGGGTTFIFVAFARSLGVGQEQMGAMTFLISMACVLQMVALPLIARIPNKKRFALTLAFTEPILAIVGVLLALWLPPGIRLIAFGLAVFMAAASVHLSRPVTDDWVASTIPSGIRGRYLGRRLQIVSTVVIITTLAVGSIGEKAGMTNTPALGGILLVGAVCAILAVYVIRHLRMPTLAAASQPAIRDLLPVSRTPAFVRFMAMTAVFNIPFFLACPYYQVFNLEIVAMPASMIAVMQSGYFLVKIFSLPMLGRLLDRWGPRRVCMACGVVYAAFFATFPFCREGFYWPLFIAWAFVALGDGAYGLATQSALYDSIPTSPMRPTYFAAFNIGSISLAGIGGFLAVPILEAIKGVHLQVGDVALGNFHLLYAACAIMMIPCALSSRWLVPHSRHGS